MNNAKPVILLLVSTFMASILAMGALINAQAQLYDHYNAYPDSKKGSDINLQELTCIDSNINVNGVDITQIPQDGNTNIEAGPDGANTQNGNGPADRINFNKNLVNVCLNVNMNEQVNSPPANLLVTQTVTCDDPDQTRACLPLRESIRSDGFSIVVDGNNPNPSQFLGSAEGQNVVLGSGGYSVTETPLPTVADDVSSIEESFGDIDITGPIVSFAGDCTQTGTSFSATGTILGGQSQTCEITNLFEIEEVEECISSDINSAC